MEQKETRQQTPQETIWKKFAGKRIVLAGNDHQDYQAFLQKLAGIRSQMETGFRVFDGLENVQEGDFVLLFARTCSAEVPPCTEAAEESRQTRRKKRGSAEEEQEDYNQSWVKSPESWLAARTDWEETLRLLELMTDLGSRKPKAVLLISGNEVYGKVFGTQRPLKEEETGYVCHTDSRDMAAQCLRTAEHFACKLAREEGVPFKTVRIGRLPENEEMESLLTACMRVLLYGENGEIYNVSEEAKEAPVSKIVPFRAKEQSGADDAAEQPVQPVQTAGRTKPRRQENRSFLSPVRIVTDTQKSDQLGK